MTINNKWILQSSIQWKASWACNAFPAPCAYGPLTQWKPRHGKSQGSKITVTGSKITELGKQGAREYLTFRLGFKQNKLAFQLMAIARLASCLCKTVLVYSPSPEPCTPFRAALGDGRKVYREKVHLPKASGPTVCTLIFQSLLKK